jgi:hypothetical protein
MHRQMPEGVQLGGGLLTWRGKAEPPVLRGEKSGEPVSERVEEDAVGRQRLVREQPERFLPAYGKMPDQTLMLVWSIILTCLCSICGIVGLVKTIKAQKEVNPALKYKLLSSAKIWLIVGTALRVLPFLAELF